MTTERLRPKWTDDELKKLYAEPHDSRIYGLGHHVRVQMTIAFAKAFLPDVGDMRVADMSCGNALIPTSLSQHTELGDYAPRYQHTGPLEQTLHMMERRADLYICSETLEHLDDPHYALELIRAKATRVLVSTPIENWEDTNGEHYWSWDRQGVEDLLASAGFTLQIFASLDTRVFGEPYLYGMWIAS